ncbi:CRISPR-associated endonuclease Cas1 [Synechococcus elongatus IITB4]|uniref:CRISPR-associated endonuclease Cas1 n=1 Tax=Synechococcus elongatus TaxID=32046 RepID=UPI0030D33D40
MKTLYLSRQGSRASLRGEQVRIEYQGQLLQEVQLPLLEQILVFGQVQLTTPLIRSCLQRNVPIAYLSRLGWCYGRAIAIERGYRHLSRYQQELGFAERLQAAKAIVRSKLRNSRKLLLRQDQRHRIAAAAESAEQINYRLLQVEGATDLDQLRGLEGAAAAAYFAGFSACLSRSGFRFVRRSKRPPHDPSNALLSFGYQVIWNHLLTLVELHGLDPYQGCLHEGSERHAALVSDLVESFRAPLIDAVVLELVNRSQVDPQEHFEERNGGCFLNEGGRRVFLQALLTRMEEPASRSEAQPRWDLLNQQVKEYRKFVYQPVQGFEPYRIR